MGIFSTHQFSSALISKIIIIAINYHDHSVRSSSSFTDARKLLVNSLEISDGVVKCLVVGVCLDLIVDL